MKYKVTMMVLLMLVALVGTASAIFVANPGFETGDFTGWTQSGNTSYTGVDGNPHSGSYAAYFGPIGSDGYITQTLTTTVSEKYSLNFWLYNTSSPSDFVVYWNGALVAQLNPVPDMPWTSFTYTNLMATGIATDLTFGFRNDPSYVWLDDVAVDSMGTVPEPGSLLLVGTVLGLGTLVVRRRRRQA